MSSSRTSVGSVRSARTEVVASVLLWAVSLGIAALFVFLLFEVVRSGVGQVSWSFLTEAPNDSGRAGGILTVCVSTVLILAVCLACAVPLGVGSALYLSEFTRDDHLRGRFVRRSLDLLASVPSIVFGLFGMVFFCQILGMGFSILAGGLTLATMVLPVVIRTTEAGLRAVPAELRLGAAALGLTRATSLWHLLLPAAANGVVVGVMLGIGRAMAETAALIFTSGYVTRMPSSLLDSGRSLSVHIYDLAMNVPGGEANAYGSAFVLLGLLVAVNALAGYLGDRFTRARFA